ncbi:tetratricopeptide repeat protein [uncultured Aquimarina sp.]|uniref:tetratricopeptide repeat-containing sensor histidine kinase n=1 Tax=uncultured Aquimarina sp. TaxID=575652 RepID=UPI00260729E6|nr:tetratricopeptide repeat protein [uncultured Aquimarina sp.]
MNFLKWKSLAIFIFYVFIGCNRNEELLNNEKSVSNLINELIKESEIKSLPLKEREFNLIKALELVNTFDDSHFKVDKLQEIASSYYYMKNYYQLNRINEKALKLSKSLSDSVGIAKSYNYKAIWYRNRTLDSTYKYFYAANKIYIQLEKNKNNDPIEYTFDQGRTLIDLAKLSRIVKNYRESEDLTIQAIQKFELSGNLQYIPLSYNNLGIIAKQLERYDDAIKYHSKAAEYAKNTGKDTLYRTLMHNNTGTTYKSQKQYGKAIREYKKGLAYKDFLNKRPKRLARLLDNLGYVKFLAHKNNDSALYLFNKAYRIRDSINDIVGISTSSLHLAEYYQSKGDHNLAKEFAEKAKQAANTINENTELLQAYDLLAQVSPPEKGRTYAMKYIKLSDSLTKRDNLFRDKFARIRFESENLEKENEQKKKEIIEVQNQNTIYLLGLLLLVTFIGFLIYFSRQRNRYLAQQNKIVEFQAAYETETRISKRLHDELGNDIFQVMMQYQNDPHDPQITKKLNTAYTKARDISRENSEFEVDETYLEELTDMLTNYTKNNIKLILRGIEKISWDTVDKNLKITIYRVLQELMTNMQKHSQADLVAIVFKNEKNKLIIKYSDNGVGIQKEDIKSKNGLRNTEKRIQAINGTIIFDSEKNKGFKAEIKIPT